MKFLKEKQVDMIMVHAPAAEKKAVEEGWATKRMLIGSNEFYIVGPPEDPAGIKNAKTAAEKALFKFSLLYLAGIFASLVLDRSLA